MQECRWYITIILLVRKYNGEKLYDILMRLFDPELIKMQFQLAVASEGVDVVDYISKYPGRYISLHIHDWDPAQKKVVPTGKGVIDWKKLLEAAKKSGISDYGLIVEMETKAPGDPLQDLVECYNYLQKSENVDACDDCGICLIKVLELAKKLNF